MKLTLTRLSILDTYIDQILGKRIRID